MRDCGCIGSLNTYPKNSKNRKRMFHLEFFKKFVKPKFSIFLIFFLSIFEFFFTCFFYANRKKSITLKKQFMDISKIYSWFFFCVLQKKKNQPYTLQKVIVTFIFHTYWSKNGNIVLKSTVFWIFSKVEKISKKTLILVCFQ